ALLLGDRLVHREEDRRGRVDGERGRHLVERDALEDRFHVGERVDRDADAADLARGLGRVGVEAELRRKVERNREPRLPLGEKVAEALVGLARRAEAGVLPHRPELAAVHRRVDAAGERELAGAAEAVRHPLGLVKRLDHGPGARAPLAHAPSKSRLAMTSYWISLVPSKMRNTRASRQKRCAGYSRE